MKRSELKNIIKECVREVILEEGMLSGIVSEVVQGLGSSSIVQEAGSDHRRPKQTGRQEQLTETKKQILDAMGQNSYQDVKQRFDKPELFEGTKPIRENSGKGALSGVDPGDQGIDITNIPGFGSWSSVASATRK